MCGWEETFSTTTQCVRETSLFTPDSKCFRETPVFCSFYNFSGKLWVNLVNVIPCRLENDFLFLKKSDLMMRNCHLREVTLTMGGGGLKNWAKFSLEILWSPLLSGLGILRSPLYWQIIILRSPPYKVCHAYCMIVVHLQCGHLITIDIMNGGYEM